jgi:AcrR family transcriptional regulator
MEDVAQRAGLSRVTVYRRFASKEALIEAVVVGEVRAFFSALDTAVGRLDSAEERLAESFAFAFAYVGRHVLFNRLLDTEPEVLLTHLTTASAPWSGRRGTSSRAARRGDPGRTAAARRGRGGRRAARPPRALVPAEPGLGRRTRDRRGRAPFRAPLHRTQPHGRRLAPA